MTTLIIIEVILALLLIILVLLQHSDNEGLGFGVSGGLGGLMSSRGSANFLSKATAIIATLFMIMSVVLTIASSSKNEIKILESLSEDKIEDSNIAEEPSIPDSN
ncbi:MAG: preprotein translocase subunit SecG [Pelagibacteraceae bacterium]|nr:preprotein translocase subunit SecG [Pelagibacteraceae bacterium]|tara:strand:- start:321 stop:635 length:315 start_codon:yes stop_codon:yes gene_type:complete